MLAAACECSMKGLLGCDKGLQRVCGGVRQFVENVLLAYAVPFLFREASRMDVEVRNELFFSSSDEGVGGFQDDSVDEDERWCKRRRTGSGEDSLARKHKKKKKKDRKVYFYFLSRNFLVLFGCTFVSAVWCHNFIVLVKLISCGK